MTGSRYPYRYERTATTTELHERFADLEPGAGTGTQARVAGRIMSVRSQGKVAFADLQDGGGRIQLFAHHGVLGDSGMAEFGKLSVGDIVGADGEVIRTRRGELSLRVGESVLLAECRRPMPEKWHGVTDVEARYRQRYLDLLLNEAPRRAIVGRAAANDAIRRFLSERGFIEVETPLLQPIASGAVARPFKTHHNALDIDLYLRIAPELYLKRLLIGGWERVYELNRSFRNEGLSPRHNTEFTMLEAYEAYVDYNDTMTLVEDLTRAIAEAVNGSLTFVLGEETVDLGPAFRRMTMFEAIASITGRDLSDAWASGDHDAIRTAASDLSVGVDPGEPPGIVVVEIFEQTTEKLLTAPTFVTGFPKEVSPLAKDHRAIPGFTEHADLVIGGVEIAPVYSELNDPDEQQWRFEQQARARAAGTEDVALPDEDFVEALGYGMPPAGGFGFGVDRFLTQLLDLHSLREVIMFPTMRPEA
ncbi:MAG TPA: lysine--tRNA ligase [Actinomycetota bacterium]|nr:lysine--tRNA ligase [Actinomycetota bacterium]